MFHVITCTHRISSQLKDINQVKGFKQENAYGSGYSSFYYTDLLTNYMVYGFFSRVVLSLPLPLFLRVTLQYLQFADGVEQWVHVCSTLVFLRWILHS